MENEGEVFPPEPERLLGACVLRERSTTCICFIDETTWRPSKLPKTSWLVLWDLGFKLWLMKEMGEGRRAGREGRRVRKG